MRTTKEQLAGQMYDAYCAAVGGLAFNGCKLPSWKEFAADPNKVKQADGWRTAAQAAIDEIANDPGAWE
jgi:hypothetical protein